MTSHNSPGKSPWLHRGRLRDLLVLLCLVSALFCKLDPLALTVALAFLAAGSLLHVLVKGQLIRNVKLCTDGAYAVVRHPYYLANYLVDISFCLLSGNIYLVLLYPFLFHWAYGPTFAQEEATLASMHGAQFEAYRASVPQVFPTALLLAALGRLSTGFSWRRISTNEIKRIVRFGFMAALLVLVHRVGIGGLRGLLAGLYPPMSRYDFALLGLCAACLLVSLAIPTRRKDRGASEADENRS